MSSEAGRAYAAFTREAAVAFLEGRPFPEWFDAGGDQFGGVRTAADAQIRRQTELLGLRLSEQPTTVAWLRYGDYGPRERQPDAATWPPQK
jgi:hypothetical protein